MVETAAEWPDLGYDPDGERLPIGVTVFWAVAALGVAALLLG